MFANAFAHCHCGVRGASFLYYLFVSVIAGIAVGCGVQGDVASEKAPGSSDIELVNTQEILIQARSHIRDYTLSANPNSFKKSKKLLMKALANEPLNDRIYSSLGHLYLSAHFSDIIVEDLGGRSAVRKKVLEMFETAVRINPNNAMAYEGLGQYYLTESPQKALLKFIKAYELESEWNTYYMMGICYYELDKYDWAEQIFTRVLRNARALENRKILVAANEYLGRISLKTGEYNLAEKYLTESVAQFEFVQDQEGSNRACPYQALGALYSKIGQRTKSKESYIKAAKIEIYKSKIQFDAAKKCLLNKDMKNAMKYFRRGIAVTDNPFLKLVRKILGVKVDFASMQETPSVATDDERIRGRAIQQRALTHFLKGDFDKVGWFFDSSMQVHSDHKMTVLRGFYLLIRRRYNQAEKMFIRASSDNGFSPGAAVGQGHICIIRKDYTEAEKLFQKVIDHLQKFPKPSENEKIDSLYARLVYEMTHLGVGWAMANRNMHSAAIDNFELVLKLNPGNILALLSKANSYIGLHKLDEAQVHLEKVLSLQPGNPYALAELGTIDLQRGLIDKAEESFQAAITVDPKNYTCPYEGLGLVYFRRGMIPEAKENLQKAIDINPDVEYRKFNALAQIYMQEGRYEEAEALLIKSQTNYPYDSAAAKLQAKLLKLKNRLKSQDAVLTTK